MSTNEDKYLVLRGKNKDIYFIQKRVSKDISKIIGKEFIKKSLRTSNIHIARQKRDQILKELVEISSKVTLDKENIIENEDSMDIVSVTTNKNSEIDHERDKMEDEISTKKQKFNIFSLKLPNNKEELIMNIDKFIPIGIVILTLFIAFVV
jgi:hypothetical protein